MFTYEHILNGEDISHITALYVHRIHSIYCVHTNVGVSRFAYKRCGHRNVKFSDTISWFDRCTQFEYQLLWPLSQMLSHRQCLKMELSSFHFVSFNFAICCNFNTPLVVFTCHLIATNPIGIVFSHRPYTMVTKIKVKKTKQFENRKITFSKMVEVAKYAKFGMYCWQILTNMVIKLKSSI